MADWADAATHVVNQEENASSIATAAPAAARLAPSNAAAAEHVQGRLSNPSADAKSGSWTVQNRDRVVDRIAWFHVPKTGSSFANTLMHLANASLPANAFLQNKSHDLKAMVGEFPMDTWFRIKFWEPWRRSRHHGFGGIGDHTAISAAVHMQFAGHFFGLFRQPINRAQSAYAYFCRAPKCNYTFAAYSQRIVGTVTKMLSGQEYGLACHVVPATRKWPCRTTLLPDVETAMGRLNSFAFVGMTDDYPRSICLLHAMFPTAPCLAGEFQNTNPTDYNSSILRTKLRALLQTSSILTSMTAVSGRERKKYTLSRWPNIGSHEPGAKQSAPVLQTRLTSLQDCSSSYRERDIGAPKRTGLLARYETKGRSPVSRGGGGHSKLSGKCTEPGTKTTNQQLCATWRPA